ncbi:unnamed protein product, partial [Ectocarpus fasciculatus]
PRPASGSTAPSPWTPTWGTRGRRTTRSSCSRGPRLSRRTFWTGVLRPSLPTGSCGRPYPRPPRTDGSTRPASSRKSWPRTFLTALWWSFREARQAP